MFKQITIFFIIVLSIQSTPAEIRSLGHLLSRNDNIYEGRNCIVGFEFLGCRASKTLIGTSPFLHFNYKLKNIYIRTQLNSNNSKTHTLDLGFVDNITKNTSDGIFNDNANGTYDMRALMFHYIYGFDLAPSFRLYVNTSYFYYMNYRYPFSLMRPDPKIHHHQINLTGLLEGSINQNWMTSTEFGILQLNAQYPRLQAGTSIDLKTENFLLKFGISITSTLSGFFVDMYNSKRNDYQQELLSTVDGYNQNFDRNKIKKDFALHPEINFLYVF